MINGVLERYGVTMLMDAKYGFWGLVILMNWQMIGYIMVIYIAGLQNVSERFIAKNRTRNPEEFLVSGSSYLFSLRNK